MAKPKIEILVKDLFERFDNNYKDVDKRLDNIEKVMIAQEINLKEHMKRSDHLEAMYVEMQKEEIDPIKKKLAMLDGALKLLGALSLILSILAGVAKLFRLF